MNDLPTPVGSIIHLEAGKTYIITGAIDLNGLSIETLGVVNLFGFSSETSSLTSTGLSGSIPLIHSEYTIVLESLTIKDVNNAISIDGTTKVVALDWKAVNFKNVPVIGTINTCSNFIYDTGAFLNASGLRFDGTIGTIAFNNSLFVGTTFFQPIIEVAHTATIERRFRIIFSSIISNASSEGLRVSTFASIPIEGFILDNVNFSGTATYLSDVNFDSETALFKNCVGITNTTAAGNMYMKNNIVDTIVTVQGDRYAVAGTSVANTRNQKFTYIPINNSLRYDSTIPRLFKVFITFSVLSGNNNIIGCCIGVKKSTNVFNPDNDRISESEIYLTTSGSRPDAGAIQSIIELEKDDEVYMIVQNTNNTTNIRVGFMNMTIQTSN